MVTDLRARMMLAACLLVGLLSTCGTGRWGDPLAAQHSAPWTLQHLAESPGLVYQVIGDATLGDIPIAVLQNSRLPGSIDEGRQLLLGGVGSDLWRSPSDPPGELWMVTDRGPNSQVRVGSENRRTFPVPGFTPTILRVRLDGPALEVLDWIPIVGQSGRPVTGLPNGAGQEEPYDYSGHVRLAYNPSGLDVEGLVRTPAGEFWAADEYGPSLVRIHGNGRVLRRYMPQGLQIAGADYPVMQALPAIFSTRAPNRGFEGLALSPDATTLYLALQSPLANPDPRTGNRSQHARILVFDIATEQVTAEYVYQLGAADAPEPTARAAPRTKPGGQPKPERPTVPETRLSALTFAGPSTLLVLERTTALAWVYRASIGDATNILGTRWDDLATNPSLEGVPDLLESGVAPLGKALSIDLATLPAIPEKLEGLAVLDATTLAVANDNDFDIGVIDSNGLNIGAGVKSRLLTILLPAPLP
jgi:hypothetical protein